MNRIVAPNQKVRGRDVAIPHMEGSSNDFTLPESDLILGVHVRGVWCHLSSQMIICRVRNAIARRETSIGMVGHRTGLQQYSNPIGFID